MRKNVFFVLPGGFLDAKNRTIRIDAVLFHYLLINNLYCLGVWSISCFTMQSYCLWLDATIPICG